MAEEKKNYCYDWDDEIESDGQEFILLPEGDYNFMVTGFERGHFPGGKKIPECKKATITLQIEAEEGTASVRTDLILHSSLEWKLSQFFRSIGQKKHGEKLKMDWSKVMNSKGRVKIGIRTYTKDGEDRQINEVKKFYDYDPDFFKDDKPKKDDDGFVKVDESEEEIPF